MLRQPTHTAIIKVRFRVKAPTLFYLYSALVNGHFN